MTSPRRVAASQVPTPSARARVPRLLQQAGQAVQAAQIAVSTVARGWVPRAAPARGARDGVQRPEVAWGGGVQHNGNNPEVVDTFGRSYSSRAFAPDGVAFTAGAPQQVFSSNKNMTGKLASTTLVLSNPGREPLRLKVRLSVDEPASARAQSARELVVPAGGSVAVPIAEAVRERGFTAFRAVVEPASDAARRGRVHVDVVSHEKSAPARKLAGLPLMKTEGERGYRVPPGRLGEHPAYLTEIRYVMKAAGVQPDPVGDAQHWTADRVRAWVTEQKALGAAGKPTAFDPAVNRKLQGRVNGLVGATEGRVQAAPFVVAGRSAESVVRLLPNRAPPDFVAGAGGAARRPGTSLKDAGAYGKDLRATLPVTNPGSRPVTLTLAMRAPPVGQDGAQLPGHQVYNGPVSVTAPGATLTEVPPRARVDQPAAGSEAYRLATLGKVTIPPGKTVDLAVALLVHANSQLPVDLVLTRAP